MIIVDHYGEQQLGGGYLHELEVSVLPDFFCKKRETAQNCAFRHCRFFLGNFDRSLDSFDVGS